MPGARDNRFTIYDALEKAGYFDKNPANSYARDLSTGASIFQGPVQYPKMLYHPDGERKIIVPAEIISTPLGPKEVGEQSELIWKIVDNEAQEQELRAEGWQDHPAKSIRARIMRLIAAGEMTEADLKKVPQIGSDQRIKDLEAEIARLNAYRSEAEINKDIDLSSAGGKISGIKSGPQA